MKAHFEGAILSVQVDGFYGELRRQVKGPSWETSFGMWTRGAFLQFCHMPRVIAFIDLNHIHELNEQLGYNELDRRVKEMFSVPFRRGYIVARWYSGDEIVILFDSDLTVAQQKIEQLRSSAAEQERTFYCEIGGGVIEIGKQSVIKSKGHEPH